MNAFGNITRSSLFIRYILPAFFLFGCSSDDGGELPDIEPPHSVQVFDIGNSESSSDIRVFFISGSGNSEVDEYRIIIAKAASSGDFDIEKALLLEPARYHAVKGTSGSLRVTLEHGIADADGDPVVNGIEYHLFILAVPVLENAEAGMSSGSGSFMLTDKALKDIYISSRTTNSVELFDGVTGEHIRSFVSSGSGGLSAPQEVIFLEDGDLIVTGRFNTAIKKYDGTTGSYIGDFTSGYVLDQPTKTNVGPDGRLYVSQWGDVQNSIVRFDLETGEFIDEVVESFFQGMDHAWDASGNFYAVSFGLKELRKYDSQFELIYTTTAELTGPVNSWVDAAGNIYVVDWQDGTVKQYDRDGNFVTTFIRGLTRVEGFLFDEESILLCDWQNNTVNRYSSVNGSFLSTFIFSDKIQQPNSITFGPDHRPNE